MSDIICKNANINEIQGRVFELQSDAYGSANPLASCKQAYNLDIQMFVGENLLFRSTALIFTSYFSPRIKKKYVVLRIKKVTKVI